MSKHNRKQRGRARSLPPREQDAKPSIDAGASNHQLNVSELVTRTEYAALKATVDKNATDSQQRNTRETIAIMIAAAALIASIGAAAGSIWQGAGTAKSVDTQVATYRMDQRAWLTVKSVTLAKPLNVGEKPMAILELTNSGKTPARDAIISGNIFSRAQISEKDLGGPPTGVLASKMVIAPGVQALIPIESDDAVREAGQIAAILNRSWTLYASGLITYKDIFDQSHDTNYCFRLDPQAPSGVGHFAACKFYNDAK